MQKLIPLNKIKPNPHRHMGRYPISEDKVAALAASFDRTGYWGNIVGREVGGFVEIAYGHHRRETMLRVMKKTAKVAIITKTISESDMLRMMADENLEEYHTNAAVEQETIRAVVQAYADGKIDLGKPRSTRGAKLRYAPHFIPADGTFTGDKSLPYNAESIARFLGWMIGDQVSPRVRNALRVLEVSEEGLVDASDSKGLKSVQAKEIAVGASSIAKSYEREAKAMPAAKKKAHAAKGKVKAKAYSKRMAKSVRSGAIGVRDVQAAADKERRSKPRKELDVNIYVDRIIKKISAVLNRHDDTAAHLQTIITHPESLIAKNRKRLAHELSKLAERAQSFHDQLDNEE